MLTKIFKKASHFSFQILVQRMVGIGCQVIDPFPLCCRTEGQKGSGAEVLKSCIAEVFLR